MYERIAQLDLFAVEASTTADCGREAVAATEPTVAPNRAAKRRAANVAATAKRAAEQAAFVATEERIGAHVAAQTKRASTPTDARAPWVPTHPTAFRRWLWEHLAKQQRFPKRYRPLAWEAVASVAAGGDVPAWIAKTPAHAAIVRKAAAWYAAQ